MNMKYEKNITLKNGAPCLLRHATVDDAAAVVDLFQRVHGETDFLLSYPDESTLTVESEQKFLQDNLENDKALTLLAVVDGKIVGDAGISPVRMRDKLKHRAEFGVSVIKDYWGLGIGRAMTLACIECAKKAGFSQLELDVVADNEAAVSLYKSAGFVEYGRNPKGFRSRYTGWQELVLMRLELD